MEHLTDWCTLWEQLSIVQGNAFARKKTDTADDFWEHKAAQFDKMVDKRWEKPDTSRDFLIEKLVKNPGATLLDIGAGTGKWSILAAPHAARVTALEPSGAMQKVLIKKITEQNIANIDIVSGTWPETDIPPHDYILASHSMYGVQDFKTFVRKMSATAKKACIMVLRAPFADSVMAVAARRVLGQPYDSPNFQIAYNALLGMDIYADVVMEADGSWPGWENDSLDAALEELKNRLNLSGPSEHDPFLLKLLETHLHFENEKVVWPAGNRSALVYWEV